MIDLTNWREHFVEKEVRSQQETALDWIANNINKYDNIVLQATTGTGKSAIAMTIGKTLASTKPLHADTDEQLFKTYITTTSIELQNQYENSYGKKGLTKLYAASNYTCNRLTKMSCKDGKVVSKQTGKFCPGRCKYEQAKEAFLAGNVGITNLAYYTYSTEYSYPLPKRGIMIFDEAHTIGEFVKSFVTVNISLSTLQKYNITKIPKTNSDNSFDINQLSFWIKGECLPRLDTACKKLDNDIEMWTGDKEDETYLKKNSEVESLRHLINRLNSILNDFSNVEWVAERTENLISMTPLTPKPYMKDVLLNKNTKNIFMSATILDAKFLMEEYDLDPEKTCYLSLDSTFPLENRPIHILPCGKIDYRDLETSLKPFAEVIKELLSHHKNEKGIIFVQSYSQAQTIIRLVNDKRLITHEGSKEKEMMMEMHKKSKNTVIISPTSSEGLDLFGDLSMFQIVVKLPFMSLGSLAIKKRAEKYKDWYNYKTALTLIQMTGRSVRSETDVAHTYILDSAWKWWYLTSEKFFPKYWKDAIKD